MVIVAFLPILAIVSLAPALPKIMEHFAGVPNSSVLVPMMVGAPGLIIALFSPLAGVVTDRWGRRVPLLLATFFYGLFGMAPLILQSLPALFASRFGVGLCEAVILTVANALITDYFPLDRRRIWLTVQAVAGPVLATATILGSSMLTAYRWNGGFLIYGVAYIIFAYMVVAIFEPEVVPYNPTSVHFTPAVAFPWRSVGLYFAVTLFSSTLYYVFIVQSGLALTAVGVKSPERLGVLISIASIGVPIGALVFGWFSKRWPAAWLITAYLALFGIGLAGIGVSSSPRMLVILAVAQQIGAGMTVPVLIFWVSQLLPPEYRGRGMGFWACAFFLGQFISPPVVGMVRSMVGGSILQAFTVMGAVAGLAALASFGIAIARRNG